MIILPSLDTFRALIVPFRELVLVMKTYIETVEKASASRKWHVVDAQGKRLGRLATEIADLLRGKGKTTFTPHVDTGDYVVVLNASGIVLTGSKPSKKLYKHHTGYIGGIKEISAADLRNKNPEEMIRLAVWGMLPKGPLGRSIVKKLKIYRDDKHPHAAQAPTPVASAS